MYQPYISAGKVTRLNHAADTIKKYKDGGLKKSIKTIDWFLKGKTDRPH